MEAPQNVGGPAPSSFLPDDYVRGRTESRANLVLLVLFAVVMAGVVGAFLVTNRRWSAIREEQSAINEHYKQEAERLDQLKILEAQRAQLTSKAEVTAALIERVPRSMLLSELTARMPKDVTLQDLALVTKRIEEKPPPGTARDATKKVRSLAEGKGARPDAGAKAEASKSKAPAKPGAKAEPAEPVAPPKVEVTLTLAGVALANNDVAAYMASLKACTLLDNVELQYIRDTIVNDLGMRRFEILATVRREPAPAPGTAASPGTTAGVAQEAP